MYLVDLGEVMQLVDRVPFVEDRMRNIEQAHVGGVLQPLIEVLRRSVSLKALPVRVHLANRFLETLLKRATNCHDLANRLHSRADLAIDVGRELGQIPFRDLANDVVEGRLEAGSGGLGDGVRELGESPT